MLKIFRFHADVLSGSFNLISLEQKDFRECIHGVFKDPEVLDSI